MTRRCPPGVICIENITVFIVMLFSIFIILYVFNVRDTRVIPHPNENIVTERVIHYIPLPSTKTKAIKEARLTNKTNKPLSGMKINLKTQGNPEEYKQLGILTSTVGKQILLPLIGRIITPGRGKWQYYSQSDQFNTLRLPLSYKGKSCTSEYGCDELTNGDNVYVEGYDSVFVVKIYEKEQFTYIPY